MVEAGGFLAVIVALAGSDGMADRVKPAIKFPLGHMMDRREEVLATRQGTIAAVWNLPGVPDPVGAARTRNSSATPSGEPSAAPPSNVAPAELGAPPATNVPPNEPTPSALAVPANPSPTPALAPAPSATDDSWNNVDNTPPELPSEPAPQAPAPEPPPAPPPSPSIDEPPPAPEPAPPPPPKAGEPPRAPSMAAQKIVGNQARAAHRIRWDDRDPLRQIC